MDLTRRERIGIIAFLIIMVTGLSLSYFINKNKTEVEIVSKNEKNTNKQVDNSVSEIKVYIFGEVKKPGVYTLSYGDRAVKLVELAGGFTEFADKSSINLAMRLKDEDYIKVLKISPQTVSGILNPENLSQNEKININTGSIEQLKQLPRIGDALAQRIVDYRNKNGPFKRIDDIKKVSGIGDKMFENLKDKITVY